MLGGGALLAAGCLPRLGAMASPRRSCPTTYAGHPFWEEEDPAKRKRSGSSSSRTSACSAALLLAAVDTAGKPGPDLARPEPRQPARQREAKRRPEVHGRREAKIAKQGAQIKVQDALS